MLNKGFIWELISPTTALLLLAAKLGGGLKIYYNYKGLHNVTVKN
jgi:CRISPR/Cas system-associated protein Csm6